MADQVNEMTEILAAGDALACPAKAWVLPVLRVASVDDATLLVGALSCDGPNSGLVNLQLLGQSICT